MSTDEPFTMRGGERRVTTILLEFPQLPCDDGGDPLHDALLVLVGLDDEIGGQGGFDRGDGEAPDPDIEEVLYIQY